MDESIGRREAHKRATRKALAEAAQRLFSERGFQATTVQEIASAAGVTERTFYRYFDGKEELVAGQALEWLERLREAIIQRPAEEPPFTAVRRGLSALVEQASSEPGIVGLWMFSDRPRPFALIRRATPRPLLRVERTIAAALLARSPAADPSQIAAAEPEAELQAELISRVAVAALRSALSRHRKLHAEGSSPGAGRLLADAFDTIEALGSSTAGRPGA